MRALVQLRPPTTDRHIAPTAHPTAHGGACSMLPAGADSYGARPPATGLLVRVPVWAHQGPSLPAWGALSPPRRAIHMGDCCSASSTADGGGQTFPRPAPAALPAQAADTLGAPRHTRHDPGFFWYSVRALPRRDAGGGWGRLYPPPEAIRGPFTSPPYHLRLGDDMAPGAPATSVTYPDILTSRDLVAVPALEPQDVWIPQGLHPSPYGNAPPVGAPMSPTNPVFIPTGLTPAPSYGGSARGAIMPSAGPLMLGPLTQTQWLYMAGAGAALLLVLALARRR